jgi:hypothetical protein
MHFAQHWWLMPVILATQRQRSVVKSQPGQMVLKILSQKKNPLQKRTSGVAQGVALSSRPSTPPNIYEFYYNYA